MGIEAAQTEFEQFVARVEPSLRRALVGHLPVDRVPDALSEAFAFAWERWEEVRQMKNPGGYLFRVAQSRSRRRQEGHSEMVPAETPAVEPALVDAMRSLSGRQRSVVWLVHGCDWTYREVADALDISPTAVGTHLTRALQRLRQQLKVDMDE